jgi:hypothetical protein
MARQLLLTSITAILRVGDRETSMLAKLFGPDVSRETSISARLVQENESRSGSARNRMYEPNIGLNAESLRKGTKREADEGPARPVRPCVLLNHPSGEPFCIGFGADSACVILDDEKIRALCLSRN